MKSNLPASLEDSSIIARIDAYQRLPTDERPAAKNELLEAFPHLADDLNACLNGLELVEDFVPTPQARSGANAEGDSTSCHREDLGDFQLIRQIGCGGMGIVYEARQRSLGRRVAVKVLPYTGMLNSTQLQRFRNEAQAAASLHHPNIVNAFFVGHERGVHFYAMRYVEGKSLADFIGESTGADRLEGANSDDPCPSLDTKPLATLSTQRDADVRKYYRSVAQLGIQCAKALNYAHSMGIVHRDIKPSNLLVDHDAHLWVTDFGLASTQTEATITASGDLIGTLRYMSPEQLDGRPNIDGRTDICSLGLTLYELLTGQAAFTAARRNELARQVREQIPPPPSAIRPSIPCDLDTIILKAVDKDPRSRYATAGELADDLERFLSHRPIVARRVGRLERTRRWVVRNPVLAGLMAFVMTLSLLLAIGSMSVTLRLNADARKIQQNLYSRDIRLVQQAINDGNLIDAESTLLNWVPSGDVHDPRGMEWYHLWHASRDPAIIHSIKQDLSAYSVAFSSERELVVGAFSHYASVWRLPLSPESEPKYQLEHDARGVRIRSMPGSNRIVAADASGSIKEWDTSLGSVLRQVQVDWPVDARSVSSISFDTHRRRAFAGGNATNGFAGIWDEDTDSWAATLGPFPGLCSCQFVASGQLVCVSEKGNTIRIFAPASWEQTLELGLQLDGVRAIACSSDGNTIAVIGHRTYGKHKMAIVVLWDTSSWKKLWEVPIGHSLPQSLAFSHSSRLLAVGDESGQLFLMDVDSQAVLTKRRCHYGKLYGLAFSPDDSTLASAGGGGTIHLWDVAKLRNTDGAMIRFGAQDLSLVYGVGFLTNDRVCFTDRSGILRFWDLTTDEVTRYELQTEGARLVQMAVAPDRRTLAVINGDWPPRKRPANVEFIDVNRMEKVFSGTLRHGAVCLHASFSQDGRFVAIPSKSRVVVFDVNDRRIAHELEFDGWIKSADFSPSGKLLCAGGERIHLFESPSFAKIAEHSTNVRDIQNTSFSSRGHQIAIVGFDDRVRLLEADSLVPVQTKFGLLPMYQYTLVFSPDDRRIVTGGMDGRIRLWHVETGDELVRFEVPKGEIPQCAFSPDGSCLVVACRDELVVYRGANKQAIERLSVAELEETSCEKLTQFTSE